MPLCLACESIKRNKRGEHGHEALSPTGKRYDYAPFAQAIVKVTEYKCQSCGTLWRYEDDKNDDFVGWSVSP